MVIFDPQKSGVPFHKFPEERCVLRRLVKRYLKLRAEGHSREASLLHAFVQTHRSPNGMSTDLGATEFVRAMSRQLDAAEEMLVTVAHEHLGSYAERCATLEDIANETDPCNLLEIICQPRPKATKRNPRIKERRLWDEAERNLIMALQLRVIEMNDSRNWVSKDLNHIAELANARVFSGQMKDVWIVAELSSADENRVRNMKEDPEHPALWVFLNERAWQDKCDQLRAEGRKFHTESVPCRVVQTPEGRFVVWVINRRKRERSKLIKFEREGMSPDSRGWKYVVVGVINRRGSVRTATRADAIAFNEYTRTTLWTAPLYFTPDDGRQNRFSNRRYWDVKINGYVLGDHEGRRVMGLCEQIVTSIGDHISVERSAGADNHVFYSGRRVREVIAPLWFGHVGIRWKADEVAAVLEEYWSTRLPDHE